MPKGTSTPEEKAWVPHPWQPHREGWGALLRATIRSRRFQSVTLALALLLTLGAADPNARYNKIGHEMVCGCGCGQILLECNHVGCPVSGPMINELHTQLASGGTDTSIFNWFAAKYGATVLASPMRGGFDNVAWITPLAVFFFATIGTALVIRVWKLRTTNNPIAVAGSRSTPAANALRDRIRRETEY